jgi:hypothetical protein
VPRTVAGCNYRWDIADARVQYLAGGNAFSVYIGEPGSLGCIVGVL